jgi:sorting nexin-13
VYRRYKKFLELKNLLVRQFQYFKNISLPFPKKQTFHNTSRDLLERRMVILNEFLNIICIRAETDTLVLAIVLEFLEPDNDDRQIHGTKVVKSLVNPIKSGMKTIKSVPDNVFGGLSKIFVTRSADKFEINDMMDANNTDYPTLTSFVNLLNAVFDLDSRSQWLKRGIQRIISAPFVSQSINKKIKEIVQKNILDPSVTHGVLCGILNNTWPNGVFQESVQREDVTKLRTRMAAKIAIFAFLTGKFGFWDVTFRIFGGFIMQLWIFK